MESQAIGKGKVEYRFVVMKDGKNILTRKYNTNKTLNWTPTEVGDYLLYCKVRDSSNKELVRIINFKVTEEIIGRQKRSYIENINKKDIKFIGNWINTNSNMAYLNTYTTSSVENETITYDFNGIGVNVHYISSVEGGIVEINVDGKKYNLDTYNDETMGKVFLIDNLPEGNHKITINTMKRKNSLSKGYLFNFNYLSVIKTLDEYEDSINIEEINKSKDEFYRGVDFKQNNIMINMLYPDSWNLVRERK